MSCHATWVGDLRVPAVQPPLQAAHLHATQLPSLSEHREPCIRNSRTCHELLLAVVTSEPGMLSHKSNHPLHSSHESSPCLCSVEEGGDSADQPGSAAYYIARRHSLVCEGWSVTLLEFCQVRLGQKLEGGQRDGHFDRDLRFLSDIAPPGNLFPPSYYMLKKVLGVSDVAEAERHVCVKLCHSWPYTPNSAYDKHDACPKCEEPRFLVQHTQRGDKLVARRKFWYLGIPAVVRDVWFKNPTWCGLRARGCADEVGGFWASAEAERLQREFPAFGTRDSVALELGFDFGQLFAFKMHSCGVIAMRSVFVDLGYARACARVVGAHQAR